MSKPISYVVVFVLGFVACALILVTWYGPPPPGVIKSTKQVGDTGPGIVQKNNNPVTVAAAKLERSVVNIDTTGKPQLTFGGGGFFGVEPRAVVPQGRASGVIVTTDGYILTNNHVVADTSKLMVTLWNGKHYPATIVGRDVKTDLAVIKISQRGLDSATFADSSKTQVGDWVIAVGNSLGLGTTVTVGVVSATNRDQAIEGTMLENAIQTDAAINRGNSGGALADINGNVIGINTAIASAGPDGGSIGIGFAIPSDTAKWVAEQLMKHGKVVRPWIGIMFQILNDDTRQKLKDSGETQIPPVNGGLVMQVVPRSPADRAGLQPLDVITEINGKKVTSSSVIGDQVTKSKIGSIIDLTVWKARTGKTVKLSLRTAEVPTD